MTAHLYEEIEMLTAERDFYREQVQELLNDAAPKIYTLGFSPQECRILNLLMRTPGQTRSHEAVMIAAGTDAEKDAVRTGRVLVSKIRRKLIDLGVGKGAITRGDRYGYTMTHEAAHMIGELIEGGVCE